MKRKVHLKYLENQSFWDFYMANKEDVDYIIDASCRMFQNIVPTEDMKLSILIELYDNGFLNRYDATQSRLNTYITSMVRGYAKNIAEKESPDLFNEGEPKHVQVFDTELNGTPESLNLQAPEEPGPENMDVRYLFRLSDNLNGPYKDLFNLIMEDKTYTEIADSLKVSIPCAFTKCGNLVEKFKNLAEKEIQIRKGKKSRRYRNKREQPLNNHARLKTRPLTDDEKNLIRNEFIKLNGVFEESKKHCTRIKNMLPADVPVFQVVGQVAILHNQVASGELQLSDRQTYLRFLNKRRKHWLTYKSDKYRRLKNQAAKIKVTRSAERILQSV